MSERIHWLSEYSASPRPMARVFCDAKGSSGLFQEAHLHRIGGGFAGDDGGNDHHSCAFLDEAFGSKEVKAGVDVFFGIVGSERDDVRLKGPEESEDFCDFLGRTQSINGRMP